MGYRVEHETAKNGLRYIIVSNGDQLCRTDDIVFAYQLIDLLNLNLIPRDKSVDLDRPVALPLED